VTSLQRWSSDSDNLNAHHNKRASGYACFEAGLIEEWLMVCGRAAIGATATMLF